MAPNRYYSENHPDKGVGKEEAIGHTQKKSTSVGHESPSESIKIVAHPDNVKKDGMGFGNKAKARGKGAASHD